MKKILFNVSVENIGYDTLNRAIFEHYGEQEWYYNDKHVKMDVKSGELEYKNGMAYIYDID